VISADNMRFGDDMDSTPVTKPNVHAEQFYSVRKPNCGLVSYNCQRRKLRTSSI